MLDKKEAVFFDLDGTLIDSMWVWKQIDLEYLAKFQLKVPEDLHSYIEGMSFTQTAEYFKNRFLIPDEVEQIKAEWNRMAYDKYVNDVPLKPGICELLEELKLKKIKTGIATSNSRELVEAILETHGLVECFDSVITSCEVQKGKPEPDIYLQSARRVFAKPENCLVFEDISMGILAGRRAGMQVCAVWDEFSDFQIQQKRKYADYYIRNYYEVLDGSYEILIQSQKGEIK